MAATVLVVEDELKIRELLRSYLEAAGFEVLSTGSGAEAIGLARTARPDLLVLDLRLPDVTGESVAAEVRSASAVPILMLTAKSSEQERIHGLELGADDYVTKPQSPRGRPAGAGHPPQGQRRSGRRRRARSTAMVSSSSTRSGTAPPCGDRRWS
jgi:CheY-like chemotaxis protein